MNKENHPATGLFVSVQKCISFEWFHMCSPRSKLLLPDCCCGLCLGYFVSHAGSWGARGVGGKEKAGLVFQNVSRVMRVRWSYDTRTKKRVTRCSFALFFPLTPLLLTTCTGSSLSSKRSWGPMFRATHTEAKDGHEHPQQTRKIMTDILLWLKLLLFLLPQRPVLPE